MILNDFHFIRPLWLLALVPLTVVLVLLFRSKLKQGGWSAVCDQALLPYLLQGRDIKAQRWPLQLAAIAAVLAVIALAGPTWQRLPAPVFRNASALVIVLDLSRTMDAQDIKPSRLTRARYKIADLLKQRKDGQTALIVYADDAFVVTPLTDDVATIDSQLAALTTDIMPKDGDNIAIALSKAVDLFKQAGLPKGQIVVITDGGDANARKNAISGNYQVSVLGVGSEDGAPIALPEGGFLKDEQGTIVVPKLNISELAQLAQAGGGIYQTITANDADVLNIVNFVDQPMQQQGQENANLLLELWDDQGPWLVLLLLPLAALSFRKGFLGMVFLLLLPIPNESYAFDWQDLWETKDQQAQKAFQQKDYANAAKQFDNPDWKAAALYQAGNFEEAVKHFADSQQQSGDNAYNQGNALAKAGKLPEAIKAYEQALQKNPDNADAKYNKDLVEKALEQQKQQEQEQQQKNQDQQQKQDKGESGEQGKQDQKQNQQDGQSSNNNDAKPEQKPEQSTKPDAAEPDQASKAEQEKAEQEKAQAAEKAKAQQDSKTDKANKDAEAAALEATEEQLQANEQWLNRIPDDPSGLLKRKFKYQYGQGHKQ